MHTPVRVLPGLTLMIGLGVSLGYAAPSAPAIPVQPATPVVRGTLEAQLIGTWVLVEATTPGTPSGIGIRQKTYTPGHWEIMQKDPKTGDAIFHHGGTYHLNGDVLEQKVEFAGAKTKSLIGKVHKFRIIMDKETYTQIAVGNQFNEVWKRIDGA